MSQSPAARAALLWALAAALQRREPNLVSRLERHGVELKVAKAEVELSVKRLRAWGARVQAQGCALQVRGVCGPADRAGSLEWGQSKGSAKSQTGGPVALWSLLVGPSMGQLLWETVWHFLKKLNIL